MKEQTGFINFYHCPRCSHDWQDEWSCACNDECPQCGLSDIEPHESREVAADLETAVATVVELGESFLADWSENEGRHDDGECERRTREFEAGRALCLASPKLLEACRALLDACGTRPPPRYLRKAFKLAETGVARTQANR